MVNNIVKKLEVFLQIAEKILLRYKTFKTYSSRHFPLLPSIEVSAEVHSQGLGHGGDENRTGKNGKHREDQQKDHGSVHEHVRIRGHFLPVSTIISHETQRQQIVDPPGLFPYNTTISPNFELTEIAQAIAIIYTAASYSAVDTFVAMLVLHACGQLSNIKHDLRNVHSCGNSNDLQMKLKKIARKHDYVNRFVSKESYQSSGEFFEKSR